MPKFDAGKWAEKEVQAWLEAKSAADAGFAWHRFPDARAARGALAAQPCDFLVSMAMDDNGGHRTVFLEVKETAQKNRLPKAKISQYGTLKKFYWTNADVMVLVYMSEFKKWVVLQATPEYNDLFYFDECPPSFDLSHLDKWDTAADVLSTLLF